MRWSNREFASSIWIISFVFLTLDDSRCIGLKVVLTAVLIILVLAIPMGVNALHTVQSSGAPQQALIISSLNATSPMGYYKEDLVYYLERIGYNITYVADGAVTVDFILHDLGNFSVVIWRTSIFDWAHTTYWFIGEKNNDGIEEEYPAEFAAGNLNDRPGIVGADAAFFAAQFQPNTLAGVKVLILEASDGNSIAPDFLTAGVTSVIFCNGDITLGFGLIDDLTVSIICHLTQGMDVYNAVYNTVSPYNQYQQPEDNLDTGYPPPYWFIGNSTLTLAGVSSAGAFPHFHGEQ